MQKQHLLIICGEPSGDLNAAALVRHILEINPNIKISGIGGPFLREAGANIYYDIKDLAIIGFFNVLNKLPIFIKLQNFILNKIKQEQFSAIILVDFSGFNLRLAKKINNKIPIIYYISPQVWASRQGRIKTIKKYVKKMIVIFKFEEEFYRRHQISVDFIGHPLLDLVEPSMEKKDFLTQFDLSDSRTTIALLPGSRKIEVKNNLPVMLGACKLIKKKIKDVQFVVAKSEQVSWIVYDSEIRERNLNIRVIEGKTYDCLNVAHFCLVASGTATLETTIMQKPHLIAYKMPLLNYLLYRPLIKVSFIGIVNIVAGRLIIPEFIQFQATPENLARQSLEILENPSKMQYIKNDLSRVKDLLGEKGASRRAAKIVIDFLSYGGYN